MKSKEEIEQLAKDFADDAHGSPTATFLEKGFINGYTQCQEDMVEDIKIYIKAFHLDVLEGIYSKEKLEWCNDWLKQSLNKQN